MKQKLWDRMVLVVCATVVAAILWSAPNWFHWHWKHAIEFQPFWLGLLIVALPGNYLTQSHKQRFQFFLLGWSATNAWYWHNLHQFHIAKPWLHDSLNSARLKALAWHYFQADWYRLMGWTALSLGLAMVAIVVGQKLSLPRWSQSTLSVFAGIIALKFLFQTTGYFVTNCHPQWMCPPFYLH